MSIGSNRIGRLLLSSALCLLWYLAWVAAPPFSAAEPPKGWTPPERPEQAGRWQKRRPHMAADAASRGAERESEHMLEALGYVSGSRGAEASGVTVHREGRAAPGLNLYVSGHGPEAILMDMQGKEVHRWRCEFKRAFPGLTGHPDEGLTQWLRRVHLYPNGDLLAIFDGVGLVKLDKDSKLLWARQNNAHHDLAVSPNGDIHLLTRMRHPIPRVHDRGEIMEDFITILDAKGVEKKRFSLLVALEESPFREFWLRRRIRPESVFDTDIFHTNSIEWLDGAIAESAPEFKRGNLLVSILALDLIAVVDLESERVVWALKGPFRMQHDPKILANGHLMLFDNMGRRGSSAVFELEPLTGKPVWVFRGSEERPFYSETCGTAQRLANGNTLITESDGGRALELTPEKEPELVWEFYNPHAAGEEQEYIATLFELLRLPADFPTGWLKGTQ